LCNSWSMNWYEVCTVQLWYWLICLSTNWPLINSQSLLTKINFKFQILYPLLKISLSSEIWRWVLKAKLKISSSWTTFVLEFFKLLLGFESNWKKKRKGCAITVTSACLLTVVRHQPPTLFVALLTLRCAVACVASTRSS
jgi:hypothetical protein